jgi:simple sugar transport system permease protein
MELVTQLLAAAMAAGTPLLFATLGGILIERSGIIQLGAEGLMLMGAVTAAITFLTWSNFWLAIVAVLVVTSLLGALHALLTVTLRANQIVSGLALTLFGSGLSAYLGKAITGHPLSGAVPKLDLPWLDDVPVVGALFGHLDLFTWISLALVVVMTVYLYQTRWGLHLKAVGDNPATADVMGIRVQGFRYGCVIVGSALMGLGGANLLMVFSPTWIEGMTAGRGWIAVALIIFARWNPLYALGAAYFFGLLDTVGFRLQLAGSPIPSYFLKMIPYVITIGVLILVGWRTKHRLSGSPQALGVPYIREQRF